MSSQVAQLRATTPLLTLCFPENPAKRHVVTSAVEHSAVLNHCIALEKQGCRITRLPVDRDGLIDLATLDAAIASETAVIALMWANNETGVIFPVEGIATLCQLFLTKTFTHISDL